MLVIARREGEAISIMGGLIRIKVLSVQGKIARIGIDAPRSITARREEADGQSLAGKEDGRLTDHGGTTCEQGNGGRTK